MPAVSARAGGAGGEAYHHERLQARRAQASREPGLLGGRGAHARGRHRGQRDRLVLDRAPRPAPAAGRRAPGRAGRPRLQPGWRGRLAARSRRFRRTARGVLRRRALPADGRFARGGARARVGQRAGGVRELLRRDGSAAEARPHVPPRRGPEAGRGRGAGDQRAALAAALRVRPRGRRSRGPAEPAPVHDRRGRRGAVPRHDVRVRVRRVGAVLDDLGGAEPAPGGALRARLARPTPSPARGEPRPGPGRGRGAQRAARRGVPGHQPRRAAPRACRCPSAPTARSG